MLRRLFSALLIAALPEAASAQAWTLPKSNWEFSLTVQGINQTGHLLTDGFKLPAGSSESRSLSASVGYGATERLSLSAAIPLVGARYTDKNGPPPLPQPPLVNDACRCWQTGLQDLGLGARYRLGGPRLAVTPSLGLVLPSHSYNYRGEAVLGRRLRELQFGAAVGARPAALPKAGLQLHYGYAVVEKTLSLPNNRSNVAASIDYGLTSRLFAGASVYWQHSHGGLRYGSTPDSSLPFPGEVNTPERVREHDRLLKDNFWRIGWGLAYSFETFDLNASALFYARGYDSHQGHVVTLGATWYLSP